jgi:hypothetical protein
MWDTKALSPPVLYRTQQVYTGALRSHQRTWAENDGEALRKLFHTGPKRSSFEPRNDNRAEEPLGGLGHAFETGVFWSGQSAGEHPGLKIETWATHSFWDPLLNRKVTLT